jgi:hypothetical protein
VPTAVSSLAALPAVETAAEHSAALLAFDLA